MAVEKPERLVRFRAAVRTARRALQFAPHLALLLLLLAIAFHTFGWSALADTFGDVTFFVLVIAVIFRREPATVESP
ncbi:MAG TPA: hypothetical protein VFW34_08715 [Candidatus Rubrimentiphilum sp.]|nr:hypothetical protein [Candidatus Rubrimentiphilum sp.]